MYIYAYIYICIWYVYMIIYVCIYMYMIWIYVCMYIYMYYTCTTVHIYIHTHIYMYIYIHIYTHICARYQKHFLRLGLATPILEKPDHIVDCIHVYIYGVMKTLHCVLYIYVCTYITSHCTYPSDYYNVPQCAMTYHKMWHYYHDMGTKNRFEFEQ